MNESSKFYGLPYSNAIFSKANMIFTTFLFLKKSHLNFVFVVHSVWVLMVIWGMKWVQFCFHPQELISVKTPGLLNIGCMLLSVACTVQLILYFDHSLWVWVYVNSMNNHKPWYSEMGLGKNEHLAERTRAGISETPSIIQWGEATWVLKSVWLLICYLGFY